MTNSKCSEVLSDLLYLWWKMFVLSFQENLFQSYCRAWMCNLKLRKSVAMEIMSAIHHFCMDVICMLFLGVRKRDHVYGSKSYNYVGMCVRGRRGLHTNESSKEPEPWCYLRLRREISLLFPWSATVGPRRGRDSVWIESNFMTCCQEHCAWFIDV